MPVGPFRMYFVKKGAQWGLVDAHSRQPAAGTIAGYKIPQKILFCFPWRTFRGWMLHGRQRWECCGIIWLQWIIQLRVHLWSSFNLRCLEARWVGGFHPHLNSSSLFPVLLAQQPAVCAVRIVFVRCIRVVWAEIHWMYPPNSPRGRAGQRGQLSLDGCCWHFLSRACVCRCVGEGMCVCLHTFPRSENTHTHTRPCWVKVQMSGLQSK